MGIKWGNIKRSVYMPIKGILLQKNSAQNWGAAYLQEYLAKVRKFPLNTFLKQIHMKSIILSTQ